MRHFKVYIAAAAIAMSTSVMTASSSEFNKGPRPLSFEIGQLIQKSNLIIEEDFKARVLFRLDEEGRIQIHSVKSDDEKANEFLMKKLNNQKLSSKYWMTGKLYELPVKIEGTR